MALCLYCAAKGPERSCRDCEKVNAPTALDRLRLRSMNAVPYTPPSDPKEDAHSKRQRKRYLNRRRKP
jgi:hypothetical protein